MTQRVRVVPIAFLSISVVVPYVNRARRKYFARASESWFTTLSREPGYLVSWVMAHYKTTSFCLSRQETTRQSRGTEVWGLGSGNPKKRSFEKWEHLVLTTSLSRSLYAHPSLPSLCSSTHSLFWLWASLTLVQQSLGVVVARCLCCVDDSVGLRSLRVSPCQPRSILGEWRYNNKP